MRRSVSRRALAVTLPLAACAGFATRAHADDDVARIDYRASAECPNAASFIAEIAARTNRTRLLPVDAVAPVDSTRTVTVAVTADRSAYRGALRIARAGSVTSERAVTGDTCVEVVSALALIAALELDPGASTAAVPAPVAPPIEPSAPSPAAPTAAPLTPAVVPVPAPRAPPSTSFRSSASPGSMSAQHRVRVGAGIESDAIIGLVPSALLGGGAFAEAFAPWRGAPSVRLSAFGARASPRFTASIGARVTLAGGRLEACPLAIGGAPLEVRFCAALDGGVILTRGIGVAHPVSVTKPWFSPGLRSRVAWTTPIGLFAELGAGITAPLVRYPFDYEVDGANQPFQAYRLSPIGATVTVSTGYHFP